MLTLFPRIRPNPIGPPPVPLEPPEPKAAEPTPEPVSIKIEEGHEGAGAEEAATETVSAIEVAKAEDGPSVDAATALSDSDVFGAFLSGMATGNPDPFIVEITAQPTVAGPNKIAEASGSAPHALPENPLEIVEPTPVVAAPSTEEAAATSLSLADAAVARSQNPEPVSEAIAAQEDAETASPELIVAGANIFDELDVLHEAATASSSQTGTTATSDSVGELTSAAQSHNKVGTEVSEEEVGQARIQAMPEVATTVAKAEPVIPPVMHPVANETPEAVLQEGSTLEHPTQELVSAAAPLESASKEPVSENHSSETAEPQTGTQELPANITQATADNTRIEEPPAESNAPQESTGSAAPSSGGEPRQETLTKPSAHWSSPRPPKPRRAKGTFFGLARVPEPETMDDSGEVEAYASAAAQAHLDAIDDTFVAHAQLLLKGRERGRVLDIGTGPGQIVIKLGYRLTRWKFVGIDRSATMIEKAIESLATAGELAGRVEFRIADGNALDFPDKSFEMVVCNSVLHHIPDPHKLFAEIARVVKPGGAILLRDLRRPSRPGYAFHVWKHGKHYSGEMRRLFIASVQAAYTEEELQKMIAASPLRDVRVFRHGKTHIGFERPLATPAASKK